jgi:hypothetical protein
MSVNKRSEPPFDGIACPMCPTDVRGLSAVAHNLRNRLRPGAVDSLCQIGSKVHDLRAAVEKVTITAEAPVELQRLYEVCQKIAKCTTYAEVFALEDELREASVGVEPLSDAHFANREHSHGY